MTGFVNADFWKGKRVFLTGHTGFKGGWAALWLQQMGAIVKGFSLPPPTTPSLFEQAQVADGMESEFGDIRDLAAITTSMVAFNPDILIHMAAQPLVRLSYREPVETYATNVMGTVHVLEAARKCPNLKAIVNITTDKCYENREWEWGYRENEPMGGHDPYSNSKGCAELVTSAYRKSFFSAPGTPALASVRAGNVIGGGDWAQDRLLPDAVRAWEKGATLHIRRPQATRPWQHVLEPLAAYLRLAQRLWESPALAGAYNFGPLPHEAATVKNVIELASTAYPASATSYENESEGPHEAGWLALETAHARQVLGVAPHWSLNTAVARTMNWYRQQHGGADARALCLADIDAWEARP